MSKNEIIKVVLKVISYIVTLILGLLGGSTDALSSFM